MNYRDVGLRRMLAGEYALGTLAGAARRRFERLLAADAALRRELAFWETRLAALALQLPPVVPRDVVWTGLALRLGHGAPDAPRAAGASARFWQAWAGLATAASLLLAVALWRQPGEVAPQIVQVPAPAPWVGMLQVPGSDARWLVTLAPDRTALAIHTVGEYRRAEGQDLELWWLASSGPVSLGLLPTAGVARRALPPGVDLAQGTGLAISLEPAGGSPTGSPTGPVLASGPVTRAL